MADEDRIVRVTHALGAADGQNADEMIALGVDDGGAGSEAYRRDVLVPT